ncbi:MMS19 C-terminal [Trinorchestia longiramus]|nr:MMS19 C-terminal [Trinorchestia longiramus]
MKDHHNVVPAVLHALPCLFEQEHIGNGDVEKLLRGLLLEVHCQSQLMLDRRNFYTALRVAIIRHEAVVDGMFSEFVLGLITAADGEKDPRNLLLLFSLVPLVTRAGPLAHMSEDLFEVVAAYFPIDFVPPVHDPYGVTQEDLSDGLRQCLCCHIGWSEYLLPLLNEKMESDVPDAKKEAYRTLTLCCERGYTSNALCPHLTSVWHCVRRDVVDGSDVEVSAAAVKALTAVMAAAHTELTDPLSVTQFVDTLINECAVHLPATESRLFLPASEILTAVVAAEESAGLRVCAKAVPSLTDVVLNDSYSSSAKVNALKVLTKIATAARHRRDAFEDVPVEVTSHAEACLRAVTSALEHHSPAVVAEGISAAKAMFYAKVTIAVTPWWRQLCLVILNVLLSDTGADAAVRNNALGALAEACDCSTEGLTRHLLPRVSVSTDASQLASAVPDVVLDALVALTDRTSAYERTIEAVWAVIEERPSPALCHALARIIDKIGDSPAVQDYVYSSWRGLNKVVGLGVAAATSSPQLPQRHSDKIRASRLLTTFSDDERMNLLQAVAILCRSLAALHGCPATHAAEVAVEILGGYKSSDSPGICDWQEHLSCDVEAVWPVTESNCVATAPLVLVLEGVVSWCRDASPLGSPTLLAPVMLWATRASVPEPCRLTAALLISSVINKLPLGPEFSSVVESTEQELRMRLKEDQPRERTAAVTVWGWVLKALEMRAAPQALCWSSELESLLKDDVVGVAAARCYSVLLCDHHHAFTCRSSSIVRLLYKQRTFERVLPSLVVQLDNASGGARHCTLLAIASLLPHVPPSLLHQHISKLVVVLVEGVRCTGEPAVVAGSVSTLRQLLQAKPIPPEVAAHVGSLVIALLALTRSKKSTVVGKVSANSSSISSNSCETDDKKLDTEVIDALIQLSDSSSQSAEMPLTDQLDQKCSVKDVKRSMVHQRPPLQVREASLVCLELLAQLPVKDVLPYRDQMVRELKEAVADHKRVVRRAAAAARTVWLQLGTTTS